MFFIKAALPHLKNSSIIINTTSVSAYEESSAAIDDNAAKGAIVFMTRSLASALMKTEIRVNAVAPDPVWTPLPVSSCLKEMLETFETYPLKASMMRAGQSFEIAPYYVFLASERSTHMTGQVLHPNGGTVGFS